MVVTHPHAKGQGQRSLDSKVSRETDRRTVGQTDGRTEATALPPMLTRSVKIENKNEVAHRKCKLGLNSAPLHQRIINGRNSQTTLVKGRITLNLTGSY